MERKRCRPLCVSAEIDALASWLVRCESSLHRVKECGAAAAAAAAGDGGAAAATTSFAQERCMPTGTQVGMHHLQVSLAKSMKDNQMFNVQCILHDLSFSLLPLRLTFHPILFPPFSPPSSSYSSSSTPTLHSHNACVLDCSPR
ncbi:hypothetical protein TSMEX_002614 [Taenia solium]|eukprot:TsM_000018900 transcript=TsM_000018900 gene=TsM_000018900